MFLTKIKHNGLPVDYKLLKKTSDV